MINHQAGLSLRVYRQWRLNSPIGNNGEWRRVARDVSNLWQNVARSKLKVSGRWLWSCISCRNPDGSFRKLPVWELGDKPAWRLITNQLTTNKKKTTLHRKLRPASFGSSSLGASRRLGHDVTNQRSAIRFSVFLFISFPTWYVQVWNVVGMSFGVYVYHLLIPALH